MIEAPRAEEPKQEETPTSLIGRFLANRRRALMLGVSALLVIYGAVQAMGMLNATRTAEPSGAAPGQSQSAEPRKNAANVPAPAAPPAAIAPEITKRESALQPLVAPTPTISLIAPARSRSHRPRAAPAGSARRPNRPRASTDSSSGRRYRLRSAHR